MKYDWEDEAEEVLAHGDLDTYLPEHMAVVAVAVINKDTGEAALIQIDGDGEPAGSFISADYWKDISSDAHEKYTDAVTALGGFMGRRNFGPN